MQILKMQLLTKDEIMEHWKDTDPAVRSVPTCPNCRDNLTLRSGSVKGPFLYCANSHCGNSVIYDPEQDEEGHYTCLGTWTGKYVDKPVYYPPHG